MRDNFAGFSVNLFQDEDDDWLAHLVEMPGIQPLPIHRPQRGKTVWTHHHAAQAVS